MSRRLAALTLRNGISTLLLPLLALLLLRAAVLLYQGIHQLSEGDYQTEKKALLPTSERFRGDFSQNLREVVVSFRPLMRMTPAEIELYLAEVSLHSEGTTPMPGLVKTVGLATLEPDGGHCRQFDFGEMNFQLAVWPRPLLRLREVLHRKRQAAAPPPLPPPPIRPHFEFTHNQVFCFLPVVTTRRLPRPGRAQRRLWESRNSFSLGLDREAPQRVTLAATRAAGRNPMPNLPVGWVYLELDFAWIRNELIPGLIQRHFGDPVTSPYRVAVLGTGKRILYPPHSGWDLEQLSHLDHHLPLTLPLTGPDRSTSQPMRPVPDPNRTIAEGPQELRMEPFFPQLAGPYWALVAQHKSGSLQQEIAARRQRNLVLGFTILLLIGTSAFVVVVAGQRAARLAHQRIEFVAGITHELRTPLAVIDSAGANLSRGLVCRSDRLEIYGATIQKESRRLADLVDQILEFSGLEVGHPPPDREPVDPVELVEQILAEFEERFRDGGWVVEKEIEPRMPALWANFKSLSVALRNLFDNALKYAASGRWIGIAVRAHRRGSKEEVEISIRDRGPGIRREELERIFEPFYRGGRYLASSTSGSGLGLSLVQRHLKLHGGRVTVKSEVGKGASFTLHVPAVSTGATGV